MAEQTAISWTDATFNPWIGCTKVSPGCDHCYAARREDDRLHRVRWGAGQPRQRTKTWGDPVKWNKQPFFECMGCRWRGPDRATITIDNPPGFHPPVSWARGCPACRKPLLKEARQRVFCASLADVFDNEVDVQWRVDLFRLIAATPNLDWLLLTKRIGNAWPMMLEVAKRCGGGEQPMENVWLGATVVNQAEADRDIPRLLAVPARVRFLSIEPMLGAIQLPRRALGWKCCVSGAHVKADMACGDCDPCIGAVGEPFVDWIIAGGESGPKARPAHPDWFRSLRDQCAAAGVPFHFKQWGEFAPEGSARQRWLVRADGAQREMATPEGVGFHAPRDGAAFMYRLGKAAAGRLLDGVEHNGFPAPQLANEGR
jgi:protein gp37